MRLRHKPWAKEKLEQYPQYVILNPEGLKGQWDSVFDQNQPLHIEIGTGKAVLFLKWQRRIQRLTI